MKYILTLILLANLCFASSYSHKKIIHLAHEDNTTLNLGLSSLSSEPKNTGLCIAYKKAFAYTIKKKHFSSHKLVLDISKLLAKKLQNLDDFYFTTPRHLNKNKNYFYLNPASYLDSFGKIRTKARLEIRFNSLKLKQKNYLFFKSSKFVAKVSYYFNAKKKAYDDLIITANIHSFKSNIYDKVCKILAEQISKQISKRLEKL